MCRILAYQGSPRTLAELVYSGERSFVSQSKCAYKSVTSVNADGFGVGWFGKDNQPGRYRDVLPAWGDENLQNLSEHISSTTMFAHIRASTEAETSRANCHPFKHKRWLFMHNGQVPEFLNMRRSIEAMISDDDYIARLGTTDSEAVFLAFFSHGLDKNPVQAVVQTLSQLERIRRDKNVEEPIRFTSALSNGESLYVFRYASDDTPPSLYYRQSDNGSTTVSSEPTCGKISDWKSLGKNTVLVSRNGHISLEALQVEG